MQVAPILLEIEDGIATITLNRPAALNALTAPMCDALLAAFDRTDADDQVRAVIVTGAGRGFCAGADLSQGDAAFDMGADPDGENGIRRDVGGLIALRIFKSLKPVISACNGPAVGFGVTLQLPTDVRLASTAAKFGLVFARRGIAPEAASSWFLPRIVGISTALEWCYSGRIFGPDEALQRGLVRAVLPPEELLPAAHHLAREMTQNSSGVSIAVTRQLLWRMLGAPHPMQAHRADSRAIQSLAAGPDAHEGVASFMAKRPAAFTASVANDLPDIFAPWPDPEFS